MLYVYKCRPKSSSAPIHHPKRNSAEQSSSKILKHSLLPNSTNPSHLNPQILITMQLTTVFTLLTAAASTASAWKFTGYRDQNYKGGVIIYRSGNGLVNNLCVDIITNNNKMSSFKWNRGGLTNIGCSFKLFDSHGCKGTKLASSTGDWNVAAISDSNDNRASSLWVDCL